MTCKSNFIDNVYNLLNLCYWAKIYATKDIQIIMWWSCSHKLYSDCIWGVLINLMVPIVRKKGRENNIDQVPSLEVTGTHMKGDHLVPVALCSSGYFIHLILVTGLHHLQCCTVTCSNQERRCFLWPHPVFISFSQWQCHSLWNQGDVPQRDHRRMETLYQKSLTLILRWLLWSFPGGC